MNEYRTKRGLGRTTVRTAGRLAVLCSMAIATGAAAQTQTPLTSQETSAGLESQQQALAQPAAPLKTVAAVRHVTLIGDATLSMLALQRSGELAAPPLPMLGAEASAAYARYLKSFDHPIPEHLDSSVGTVGGAAGGATSN
ncbi:DUF3613 domain-containing protein [Caballeronia sp. KNU42]